MVNIDIEKGHHIDFRVDTPVIVDDAVTAAKLSAGTFTGAGAGPVTILVAAYNAATSIYNRADYVCDGTADEVQINNAIHSLPAGVGGIVQLSEGDFSLQTNCISGTVDKWTLQGMGRATKITQAANQPIINVGGYKNIVIKDLYVSGSIGANTTQSGISITTSSTHVLVENCWVDNTGGAGILISANTGYSTGQCTVKNCTISSPATDAICFSNTNNCIISGNIITSSTDTGIEFTRNTDTIVVGNRVTSCARGVRVDNASTRTVITGNNLSGQTGGGLGIVDNGINTIVFSNIE